MRPIISNDRAKIDEELEKKIPPVVKSGGYILHTDHSEPPEVDHETMHYFIDHGREVAKKYAVDSERVRLRNSGS